MKEFTAKQTVTWMAGLERRMSSGALACVAPDERVVVVKASYKRYWSFPGGVVDKGETPRAAAARETREEVGIAVDDNALLFRMVVDRVSDIAQTYQFVFETRITDVQISQIVLDTREIEDVALVTRQQIIEGDRYYSQTAKRWATGEFGYDEQIYGAGAPAEI